MYDLDAIKAINRNPARNPSRAPVHPKKRTVPAKGGRTVAIGGSLRDTRKEVL